MSVEARLKPADAARADLNLPLPCRRASLASILTCTLIACSSTGGLPCMQACYLLRSLRVAILRHMAVPCFWSCVKLTAQNCGATLSLPELCKVLQDGGFSDRCLMRRRQLERPGSCAGLLWRALLGSAPGWLGLCGRHSVRRAGPERLSSRGSLDRRPAGDAACGLHALLRGPAHGSCGVQMPEAVSD